VCERIPYLILPVRQLSSEPFGRRRTGPIRYERAAGQAAGPVSNRNDICKPSGMPPGMRCTSAEAQIHLSTASETTVDREGDGRIREGLESLGGR